MEEMTSSPRERLILPFIAPFYHNFAQPYGWAIFRIIIGGTLLYEGWPKLMAPMAQVGFVENLGFYPGWLFSPLLAIMQVFGGLAIALGILTRPFAVANCVMLLITIYFHFSHPYGHAFLTADGMAYLKDHADLLTPQGQARLLKDGGVAFLETVQTKAEQDSLFWAAGAAIIAAFGGGKISVDRLLGKEF